MGIGDRIKSLREKRGVMQQDVCEALNIEQSTLANYENNRRVPKVEILAKIAEYYNVSVDYLLGRDRADAENHRIPVLGNVAAGIPISAIQNVEDWEEIPSTFGDAREYFALTVKGHSMEPRIWDGDRVIVHKQSDVDSGQTAVVLVNGDEATVKRVKKMEGGIMLIALNPAVYQPHFYSAKDVRELPVRIIGLVKEVRGNV
jgi:repressor LexA|nr:MAG TPA: Repressor protein CI [Caudoviricetes sp.]